MLDRNLELFKSRFCVAMRKIIDLPVWGCRWEPSFHLAACGERSRAPCARVRGPSTDSGLADSPPHPETSLRFVSASPRKRGEVKRARYSTDTVSRSRGALRPSFASHFPYPPTRGRGDAGRPMRPIAACAMVMVERTRVSQVTPESPGIPRAMVYGLYVLSPAIRICLSPSSALAGANLTPTLRRQDHTISPSAFKRPRQERHPRPPHPRPALVTLRNAPLNGTGWEQI